ncbi:MAG: hypothetical protein M1272_04910 [Firmicutes bacterium]|nr:hypothetical protein [Bacillota bacterium]
MTHALSRRHGQMAWPLTWPERLEGWQEGAAFRIDWGPPRFGSVLPDREMPFLAVPDAVLGHPAVIAPDRRGRLLAFSPWAVNEAMRGWRAYGIGHLFSPEWHVHWLNGINPSGRSGYISAHGVPGLSFMDLGDEVVFFCPEVLGPLGRVVMGEAGEGPRLFGGRVEFSESLAWQIAEDGLYLRGTTLADGFWHHGRIEPLTGEQGWYRLPVGGPIQEEVFS